MHSQPRKIENEILFFYEQDNYAITLKCIVSYKTWTLVHYLQLQTIFMSHDVSIILNYSRCCRSLSQYIGQFRASMSHSYWYSWYLGNKFRAWTKCCNNLIYINFSKTEVCRKISYNSFYNHVAYSVDRLRFDSPRFHLFLLQIFRV